MEDGFVGYGIFCDRSDIGSARHFVRSIACWDKSGYILCQPFSVSSLLYHINKSLYHTDSILAFVSFARILKFFCKQFSRSCLDKVPPIHFLLAYWTESPCLQRLLNAFAAISMATRRACRVGEELEAAMLICKVGALQKNMFLF